MVGPDAEGASRGWTRGFGGFASSGATPHGGATRPYLREHLVLHPHGGPWARDDYRFNPELQYFANRGFAVLQVNFRGSAGLGREHMMAGRKQFGLTMQDDLIDGVKWAIAEGYADPRSRGGLWCELRWLRHDGCAHENA